MKVTELTPAQQLQELHKRLQQKYGWRGVRYTWYKGSIRYVLGIREEDGIAELLRTIDDVDEIVYESSTLNNTMRAEIYNIIFEPERAWEDPSWWHVYEIQFVEDDTWFYLLRNDDAEVKSRPYQVILRTGKKLEEICAEMTKTDAKRIYKEALEQWGNRR